ncbi:MAG: S1 family peptidase [Gordonia sp. (in: high G+C Gram-positive bacteria)]|uniref:S1 family peptidase n=1 Tax=Gordonia sp. (in: high G+C Gram-positive bacteria) TaxID=84139 RepID=UPI0039E42E67
MSKIKAALFALLGVALLVLAPFATNAGEADAAPKAKIGGGSGIIIDRKYACTMTTVGHDRSGSLIGLTAAHCGKVGSTIRSERNPKAGIIGRFVLRSKSGDFAVVRLDPSRVQPVRQVGQARIVGVGRYPRTGNVCKMGRTTGYTCGPVLEVSGARSANYVCANHGDSGGPVIRGNRVVAMLNGATDVAGVVLPCYSPGIPVFTPMVATKMSDIVASLTRYGHAGAGFRPI